MKKHRTVWGLVAAALGVTLLLVGVATASNMGFKFVPQIPGTAGANAYNLSLPWNNNYTSSVDLLTDIAGAQGVAQFSPDAKLTTWYPGGGTTFSVSKGEAYIVFGSGAGQTPVIVGSHDPSFTFSFVAGKAKNVSAPYHQTFTNAVQLLTDLNTKCPSAISSVAKFTPDSKLVSWYPGGGTTFDLTLGQGVIVFAQSNCNGYVWPHY